MADAQGWLPPWPRWWGEDAMAGLIADPELRQRFADGCPPLPLAMFTERHPPAPGWPGAPGAYLLLSEAYQDQADRAQALGWPVAEQLTDHLAPLTRPGLVSESLRGLLDALGIAAAGPAPG